MAKKRTKSSKKASKRSKKVSKTTKKSSKKPKSGQGVELLPEQLAQMWVLREEGHSLREIAEEVGCHLKSVQREFQKDPARHASIVRAQQEERAALWRQAENKSLKILLDALDDLAGILRTESGRKRRKFTDAQIKKADLVRKMVGPLRMAADSATNRSQLLTGNPTEIVGSGGGIGLDPSQMTEDEIIQLAIEHDLIHKLPAALQEKVKKLGHDLAKDP